MHACASSRTPSRATRRRSRQAAARLAALQESAERNRAQPINDENFEKFFGYPGKARRNTTWQQARHPPEQ